MADVRPEIASYYNSFAEESRLTMGPFQLEFERTKEILTRVLPPPPARIVDVGGATGVYARWMAARGHEVQLYDPVERHVEEARALQAGVVIALDLVRQLHGRPAAATLPRVRACPAVLLSPPA